MKANIMDSSTLFYLHSPSFLYLSVNIFFLFFIMLYEIYYV